MRDDIGISPLGYAILNERTEIKDYLLEQGCTLDDDVEREKLIIRACGDDIEWIGLEVVRRLVEDYGVNPKGDL